jgi:sigma-B regulation protein RsbU (phosphoserine phosphatase)
LEDWKSIFVERSQMRILIAEDDPVSRRVLEAMLAHWGYEVIVTSDGAEAWEILQRPDAPPLAILDWLMPGMDGIEVCQRVRQTSTPTPTYIILLTVKTGKEGIVTGLEAGADDYITKPFDHEELHARLLVGVRVVGLQRSLAERVRELEDALSQVKHLQGLLPICSYCKKIRDDQNYWQRVDTYISKHSDVRFSHGICPDCYGQFVEADMAKLKDDKKKQ